MHMLVTKCSRALSPGGCAAGRAHLAAELWRGLQGRSRGVAGGARRQLHAPSLGGQGLMQGCVQGRLQRYRMKRAIQGIGHRGLEALLEFHQIQRAFYDAYLTTRPKLQQLIKL